LNTPPELDGKSYHATVAIQVDYDTKDISCVERREQKEWYHAKCGYPKYEDSIEWV